MAATLSEVYQKARHSLLVVRDGVERLERAESSSSSASSSSSNVTSASSSPRNISDLSMFVKREIGQLENFCAELERLWRSQLPKAQRDMWKRKTEQLQEEIDFLKSDVEKVMGRHRKRQIEAQEREELLQRSNGDAARVLQVYDEEANALQSVTRSATMVEEAYATGVAILSKYAEQREHLKRAHRKALDILNTVGLSNSVLRVIERRLRMDKWIAYGGMIIVCIVVIAFWFWMH